MRDLAERPPVAGHPLPQRGQRGPRRPGRRTARRRRSGTRSRPSRTPASRAARSPGSRIFSTQTRSTPRSRSAGQVAARGRRGRRDGRRGGRRSGPRGRARAPARASPRTPPGPPGARRRARRCRRSAGARPVVGIDVEEPLRAAPGRPSSGSDRRPPCGSGRRRASIPRPAPRASAARTRAQRLARRRGRPTRGRVDDVVAVGRPGARLQRRRQVQVRDPEVAQVRHQRARRGEAEVATGELRR